MIRTNLATRPFYNERAVYFWLLIIALLGGAATAFNVSRLLRYSRSDTLLATEASRDEARSADLRTSAGRLRASVDAKQIEAAFGQAREANDLIDRRTFSWTELLNQFEATLPGDARIMSVRPRVDKDRGIVLAMTVLAVSVGDLDKFMENLIATGHFTGILSREEHPTETGQLQASIEAVYLPKSAAQTPASDKGAR